MQDGGSESSTSSSPSKSALGEMGRVKHCCFLLVRQKAEDRGFLRMFPALLNCVALSKALSLCETVGLLASGIVNVGKLWSNRHVKSISVAESRSS